MTFPFLDYFLMSMRSKYVYCFRETLYLEPPPQLLRGQVVHIQNNFFLSQSALLNKELL